MANHLFFYLCYGVPSCIVTIATIKCIWRTPEFRKHSFYRVYLYVLIVYLTTYLNTYIVLKLRELPIAASIYIGIENVFPPYRICFMFMGGAFHLQHLALIMLHLNRLTVFCSKEWHERIWCQRNLWICIVFTVLLANGVCYELLLVANLYALNTEGVATYAPGVTDKIPFHRWLFVTSNFAYPVVQLVLNAATLLRIFYLRCRKQSMPEEASETPLFFIGFISFIIQALLAISIQNVDAIIRTFLGTSREQQLGQFLAAQDFLINAVSDQWTLSEAYIGLIVSADLRTKFIRMYFPGCSAVMNRFMPQVYHSQVQPLAVQVDPRSLTRTEPSF